MKSTDTVLTQYLNLSLKKTVFISYQNETRKEENVSYFCVLYGNDYVFDFNLCLFLHVSWRLFSVSPAAVMIAIVQQVVK